MSKQRTISKSVSIEGVGVHSGEAIKLTLHPAQSDYGIVFRRTDLEQPADIAGAVEHVVDTSFCTKLGQNGAMIATVEHLVSAFAGLGIDNCIVEINGPELPIMDGSAAPFFDLITQAGIVEQDALKKYIRIKKRIEISEPDKSAYLEPYDGFKVSFEVGYDHPYFTDEIVKASVDFTSGNYHDEISKARTYGFLSQYEYVRQNNLARGASYENTVVIGDAAVENKDGTRYPDECVRHKILDAIGDMYLIGHPIIGHFHGFKSGHDLNNRLMLQLQAEPDSWEWVSFSDGEAAPVTF